MRYQRSTVLEDRHIEGVAKVVSMDSFKTPVEKL